MYTCGGIDTHKFLILQEVHLPLANTRDSMVIKLFFFFKKCSRLELGHCFLHKCLSEAVKLVNIWQLYSSLFEKVGITLFSLKAGCVFLFLLANFLTWQAKVSELTQEMLF